MTMWPWMLIALGELGTTETKGSGDNPRIVEYLETTTIGSPHDQNDETPWCSAFVNWCMEQAGLKGTKSAAASSWRHWGRELEWGEYGCVVVMTRPGGNHVGFYLDENEAKGVKVVGGNQSDSVCERWYPWDLITNFRWPTEKEGWEA